MTSSLAPTRLVFTHDTLTPGLKAFPTNIDRMVGQVVDYYAVQAEAHMKTNAPWNDQTGNARNGLSAQAFHEPSIRHGITLAHGVPYGIWLEVRFEGKNAIVGPTLQEIGPQVMQTLNLALARI